MTIGIHSTALIGPAVKLGTDVEVGPFSILHDGVIVAEGVQIGAHCELGGLGGRVFVGSHARLSKGCRVAGDVEVGDNARLGENCLLDGVIRLGRGAEIAEQASVRGQISLGDNVTIGASSTVSGVVSIGDGTQVFASCSIGALPQHQAFSESTGFIEIGRDCVIREFVTVHLPTTDRRTHIGDQCYIMTGCHIAHDCHVGETSKWQTWRPWPAMSTSAIMLILDCIPWCIKGCASAATP